MFRGQVKRLHLVGIGGSGMSGIAEVLFTMGYDVRGSDLKRSEATERLAALGVPVHHGHRPEAVRGADVVAISSAVGGDDPEVRAAHQLGVPVIQRVEMLAELMRLKYGIAVAGSHGKTTSTSLIACALQRGGLDPTHVIGGRVLALGTNARLGRGEWLVAEADESDGSFLRLAPTIAVVTNIDAEHLDYWRGGLPALSEAFARFAGSVPFYGAAVLCIDSPPVRALLPRVGRRTVTYGFAADADWRAGAPAAEGGAMAFDVHHHGRHLGRARVGLIGQHNVLNGLAALAVADEVGVPTSLACEALAGFAGIARRFEVKGEAAGVLVVDDYGHHPSEIAATLTAAHEAFGRPLAVAFQPHRYSRTALLADHFASALQGCQTLLLLEHYPAGEAPLPGIDSAYLAARVRAAGHRQVHHIAAPGDVAGRVAAALRPGDLLITLGAGDVTHLGDEVLARLSERAA